MDDEIRIRLLPAVEDGPLRRRDYQLALRRFETDARESGLDPGVTVEIQEAFNSGPSEPLTYLGEFSLKVAPIIIPALGALLGGWLQGRYGRKVRLKFNDVEAEAANVEDIQKLIRIAEEAKQKASHKIIT